MLLLIGYGVIIINTMAPGDHDIESLQVSCVCVRTFDTENHGEKVLCYSRYTLYDSISYLSDLAEHCR